MKNVDSKTWMCAGMHKIVLIPLFGSVLIALANTSQIFEGMFEIFNAELPVSNNCKVYKY